jgi:nucleotide-binding universal stress UspA family protein
MTKQRIAGPFPLKQVLVLSDLSTASANAAWRGALLARDHGAWLRLLHVGRLPSTVRHAEAVLEALAWELQERLGIAVLAQSVRGSFRREAAAAAAEADLLVVRSAQARPLRDWLTGFHPERLVQSCQVPTLVVRKPAAVSYGRVLAAVDNGDDAASKVAIAAAMTRAPHKEVLRALMAEEDRTSSAEPRLRGDRHRAAKRLRTVVQGVMEETDAARRAREAPLVVFDHSADMLLASERSILADLVVIGRAARNTPAWWAPRTNSRIVLAHALSDVLVLPAAQPEALSESAAPGVAVT